MTKFQLLEWALGYDAYKRQAYGHDRLADLVEPLHRYIQKAGEAPEWAGVDLLRALAFFLNRQLNWSGDPTIREDEVISELRIIADAVARHPDSEPLDRFNPQISLTWKKGPACWTATVPLTGVNSCDIPSDDGVPIVLYRIIEVTTGFQIWAWLGCPHDEFLQELLHMPTAYFCQMAMRMGFYPNLVGAKSAVKIDATERLYMGKPP